MGKFRLFLLSLIGLLMLMGCQGDSYEEDFADRGSWTVNNRAGIDVRAEEERLLFRLDFPDTLFWTTAGRDNLADGTFSVDATPLTGSPEVAYGIVIRADDEASGFYYLMISADGYYTVGGCQNACAEAGDFILWSDNPPWVASDGIATGFNQTHNLRIEARGRSLVFFIDDTQVEEVLDGSFTEGDIGLIVQTFDAAATVAFDNLTFAPIAP